MARLPLWATLLIFGCARDFNPIIEDDPISTASTGETVEGESSSGGDTSSESEGESGSDTGSDTGEPIEPGCGNGILEPDLGEECDGEDIDTTCEELFETGSGTLGCWDDCTYDVSACSLGGETVPDEGMWSLCESYMDCLPPVTLMTGLGGVLMNLHPYRFAQLDAKLPLNAARAQAVPLPSFATRLGAFSIAKMIKPALTA